MPINSNDNGRAGRPRPNESENQPGYEPEDEAQRGGQCDAQRRDQPSGPPPGGIDPRRKPADVDVGEDEDVADDSGEPGQPSQPKR